MLASALLCAGGPLSAAKPGAGGINLVNETGHGMSELFIRRTGTQNWQTLTFTPPQPGWHAKASSTFTDPDCAFDIKATLDDGSTASWPGLILCEVKSLTLNRNAAGVTWADYD